jgi:hypothetical protein
MNGRSAAFGAIIVSILATASLSPTALATPVQTPPQTEFCDPGLAAPRTHPFGYRARGDRCEGIYVQDVGQSTLTLVSLTRFFEEYDLASGEALRVTWTAPGNAPVQLQARSVKPRLYFRMDTTRPHGATSYVWPSNVLAALAISRQDLGVLGWVRDAGRNGTRAVYLPLRIQQRTDAKEAGRYQATLLAGRELSEVYVTLAKTRGDGAPETFLKRGEALGFAYYPAGRRIDIPISGLKEPGVYYLEIGATLTGGGVTAAQFLFLHAPV